MVTFSVSTELEVSANDSSLRSTKSHIEQELSDIQVGVDGGNISSQLPGGAGTLADGGATAAGGTAIIDELETQTETLIDIQDTIEQGAVSGAGFGGGGGGGGGLFAGATLGTILGGGKSKLTTLITKAPFKRLLSKVPSVVGLLGTAKLAGELVKGDLSKDDVIDTTIKMGNLVTGGLAPNDFVAGAVGAGVGGYGILQIGSLVTGKLSSTALSGYLGSTAAGTIINPFTGSLVTLLGGTIMLGDLINRDISSWNLAGKFGKAFGQGFEKEWPGMADKIHTAFTNNPFYDMGRKMRQGFQNAPDTPISGLSHGDSTHPEATPPGDGTDINPGDGPTTPAEVTEWLFEQSGSGSQSGSGGQSRQPTGNRAWGRQINIPVNDNRTIEINANLRIESVREQLRREGIDDDVIEEVAREWPQIKRNLEGR
jgi:hypothetical protein